jgi:hypothetical protein
MGKSDIELMNVCARDSDIWDRSTAPGLDVFVC